MLKTRCARDSHSRRGLLLFTALSVAVLAGACGGLKADSRSVDTRAGASIPLRRSLPGDNYWSTLAPQVEAIKEVEYYGDLRAAIAASDVIGVGIVEGAELGRVVPGVAGVPPTQFAQFSLRTDSGVIAFEMPMMVSSSELRSALDAARVEPPPPTDPRTGDPAGPLFDADKVAAAYQTLWSDAARESIQRVNEQLPRNRTIVLLRALTGPETGAFRLVNSAGLIVDDAGAAAMPIAPADNLAASLRTDLQRPFDELVAQVNAEGGVRLR